MPRNNSNVAGRQRLRRQTDIDADLDGGDLVGGDQQWRRTVSLGGHTFTFTDSAAAPVQLAFYDANPGANSQAEIESFIKGSSLFGLSSSKTLSFGASNDSISANTTIAAPVKPYDYLAVHVGQGELLFHWSSDVSKAFNITGSNLSNYRAYVSAVPEPSSYAMLLGGLGLMALMRKRRKQA